MVKLRARRDERPSVTAMVVRGVSGPGWIAHHALRASAELNHDLYGFYGISVWVVDADFPIDRLERTKLLRFDRYATFAIDDLRSNNLGLWATGQRPHYDVVYGDGEDLAGLVEKLSATPYDIRVNPQADREERR